MKIAVCDDSLRDAEALIDICKRCKMPKNTDFSIITESVRFIKQHAEEQYDMVLLDVEMPGIDGIMLGREIKTMYPHTVIIFVTSFPQYAIESYDCEAFYYLLKPCSEEKLNSVLQKALKFINRRKEKIVVYKRNLPIRIWLKDIYYIECIRKHIIFHFANDEIEITGKLSDTYEMCKEQGFLQVHQGYIVNMSKIAKIQEKFVLLNNGMKVEISFRRKSDVLLAYANFLEEKS